MKKFLLSLLVLVGGLALAGCAILQMPSFGKLPDGERLKRIEQSPNYQNGEFQNLTPTKIGTGEEKSVVRSLWEFATRKIDNLRPNNDIPTQKTDLHSLDRSQNVFVWLGHSSYFMQIDGKRYVVDPVLVTGAPFAFLNKFFKGSDRYQPNDLPDIDYLIITHDHWDHLDYDVIKAINKRVGTVVTALGVGSHLEYWGVPMGKIVELDWQESQTFGDVKITSLPARHFSGRGLTRNKTLWSSFMLETPTETVYIGGDSGYDDFYYDIGNSFPNITLAIMENGQYDKDWANIHILPDELPKAIKALNPERVITVHNSKFALARHHWKDPMEQISRNAEKEQINLLTPMIGELFNLNDKNPQFSRWWEQAE